MGAVSYRFNFFKLNLRSNKHNSRTTVQVDISLPEKKRMLMTVGSYGLGRHCRLTVISQGKTLTHPTCQASKLTYH